MTIKTRSEILNRQRFTLSLMLFLVVLGLSSFRPLGEQNNLTEDNDSVESLWGAKTMSMIDSLSFDIVWQNHKQTFTSFAKLRGDSGVLPTTELAGNYFIIEEFTPNAGLYKRTILFYKNDSSSSYKYYYNTNQKDSGGICCFNYSGGFEMFSILQNKEYSNINRAFSESRNIDYQKCDNPLYVPFYYKSKKPSKKGMEQLSKVVQEQISNTYYIYSFIELDSKEITVHFRIPPDSCNVKICPAKTRN